MGCSVAENGKGAKNELWNHIVPAIQTLYTYIQKKTTQEVSRRWSTKSMTEAPAKARFCNKILKNHLECPCIFGVTSLKVTSLRVTGLL